VACHHFIILALPYDRLISLVLLSQAVRNHYESCSEAKQIFGSEKNRIENMLMTLWRYVIHARSRNNKGFELTH
jgi:hypothetical protein